MSLQPLDADLNILSALVIPEIQDDLDIIQKLDDEPNDTGGLTASELKAKFDESGNIIKNYLNNTLLPAISDTVAEADERTAAEAARVQAEKQDSHNDRNQAKCRQYLSFHVELSSFR